jgi:glucarate dehydratase
MADLTRRRWIASAAGIAGLGSVEEMARAFDPSVPEARRPRSRMKISGLKATAVASPDRALLASWRVHDTHFRRTIVEIETADGFRGIAETGARTPEEIAQAREVVLGRDPFELEHFRRRIGSIHVFGAVETACLDLIGRAINRRVVDLLGGPYREEVRYSAYVFFVMPTPDGLGVTTPEAAAKEYSEFRAKDGFTSVKFKGGVLPPERELEALRRMRADHPDAKLRIDPNGGWSVETATRLLKDLEAIGLEYLEDPTPGFDGMAAVRRATRIPLATNMVVTRLAHAAPAFEKKSIDVVLLDNHYMGGLSGCRQFASVCEALGWGCSGHSNNHLGISMAAMTHLNAALSQVAFDADTHYPWTAEDVIQGPKLAFKEGKMAVPEGPGLGVEIDRDKLARLVENVARVRDRKDLLEKWSPGYPNARPGSRVRW